jgi:hypothetical protein
MSMALGALGIDLTVALLLILWAEKGRLGRSGSEVERHGA